MGFETEQLTKNDSKISRAKVARRGTSRPRHARSNEYSIAKIGVGTAENELTCVCVCPSQFPAPIYNLFLSRYYVSLDPEEPVSYDGDFLHMPGFVDDYDLRVGYEFFFPETSLFFTISDALSQRSLSCSTGGKPILLRTQRVLLATNGFSRRRKRLSHHARRLKTPQARFQQEGQSPTKSRLLVDWPNFSSGSRNC